MSRLAVGSALWLAAAFVVWNVIFDRLVSDAAVAFTRDQIRREQQAMPLTPIQVGFSPQVRQAAWSASLWTSPVIGAGVLLLYVTYRRSH